MKIKTLMSILFVGLTMTMVGCSKKDDPGKKEGKVSNQELFLGTWVYENFTDATGVWEEQKILPNGKVYYSSLTIDPYSHIINYSGNYTFTGENTVTFVINNIAGGTSYLDVTLESIQEYEYVGTFLNDGVQIGPLTYHKVVGEITLNVGETLNLDPSEYVDCAFYSPYAVDNKLLSLTSNACRAEKAGFTYIAVPTDKGEAFIAVTITDLENLVPDFTETLLMTREQIIQAFPLCNTSYSNALQLRIRGNEYVDDVVFFAESGQICVEYQIRLRSDTYSASTIETDIHNFLSKKYEYLYKENGKYFYCDISNPFELPLIVLYNSKENLIAYWLEETDLEELWPDFTEDLGLTMNQLEAKYGAPFVKDEDSMTYLTDNDYYWAVMYLLNSDGKTDTVGLLMNDNCDMEKALNYLNYKYYIYENGCDLSVLRWAFTNKPKIEESNVGIIFDGKNYLITYTLIGNSRAGECVFEMPYFDFSKAGVTPKPGNQKNYKLNSVKNFVFKNNIKINR